jgi:hypothetical protein
MTVLPKHGLGRGTVRRTGEGYARHCQFPSTTLRVVSLALRAVCDSPILRMGRI